MSQTLFPALPLSTWQTTRDTIQTYAQLLGKIRQAFAPPQKHWWHISLRATAVGLTTTPIPAKDKTFELVLDFVRHQLALTTSRGETAVISLAGQSAAAFCAETMAVLHSWGIDPAIDQGRFADETAGVYEETAVAAFWQAFSQIDAVFKTFKAGLRQETSPVQLWPHHFDLAVLWLSGRLVPDQDPDDPEYADEQMNFGFVTGDGSIAEPYFYVTAYPAPNGLTQTGLPNNAYWHTTGWTGAILPYAALVGDDNPQETLLTFLRAVHQAGARLMQ